MRAFGLVVNPTEPRYAGSNTPGWTRLVREGSLGGVDHGDKIKALRKGLGLTQKKLAARSHLLDAHTICAFETKLKWFLTHRQRDGFAEAFGLNLKGDLSLEDALVRSNLQ